MTTSASVIAVGELDTVLGRREEVVELLTATQDRARRAPGCLAYTFAEAVDGPGHCVVTQEWRDETTVAAHYSPQPLAEYRRRVGELLARPTHMRLHDVAKTVHPADPNPMDLRRAD
jgi:quinol monooxygenase YgiN